MKWICNFFLIVLGIGLFMSGEIKAQGSERYSSGLKVSLNEDGSRYFRFITWHQFWTTFSKDAENKTDVSFQLRRSRMLMYAQISPRFLILTHFGLNSLTAANMDPVGKSASAQLFMHDAYVQYTIVPKKLEAGAGLHYWNGISRLSNSSTLNMLTLDAPRFNWPGIGTSDQFARHLGIFLKGQIKRFDYRVAVNEALENTIDNEMGLLAEENKPVYNNEKKNFVYTGYFQVALGDQESNLLPYMVGSWLGSKRVFNIGAGFSIHPNGTMSVDQNELPVFHNVIHAAVDLFADLPVGNKGMGYTAYAVWYHFDFGPNYQLAGTNDLIATGDIFYTQMGWLLPKFSNKLRLQPYLSFSERFPEFSERNGNTSSAGINLYLDGHHAKLSMEFISNKPAETPRSNLFRIQAMVYL